MGCAQLSCGSKRPAPCSGATRRSNPRGLRPTFLRVEAVARAALAHNPVWSLAGPPVRRMRRTPHNVAALRTGKPIQKAIPTMLNGRLRQAVAIALGSLLAATGAATHAAAEDTAITIYSSAEPG